MASRHPNLGAGPPQASVETMMLVILCVLSC